MSIKVNENDENKSISLLAVQPITYEKFVLYLIKIVYFIFVIVLI